MVTVTVLEIALLELVTVEWLVATEVGPTVLPIANSREESFLRTVVQVNADLIPVNSGLILEPVAVGRTGMKTVATIEVIAEERAKWQIAVL